MRTAPTSTIAFLPIPGFLEPVLAGIDTHGVAVDETTLTAALNDTTDIRRHEQLSAVRDHLAGGRYRPDGIRMSAHTHAVHVRPVNPLGATADHIIAGPGTDLIEVSLPRFAMYIAARDSGDDDALQLYHSDYMYEKLMYACEDLPVTVDRITVKAAVFATVFGVSPAGAGRAGVNPVGVAVVMDRLRSLMPRMCAYLRAMQATREGRAYLSRQQNDTAQRVLADVYHGVRSGARPVGLTSDTLLLETDQQLTGLVFATISNRGDGAPRVAMRTGTRLADLR